MKITNKSWKIPCAIGMILSSLVPVTLIYIIYHIDFRTSYRVFKHITPSHIPIVFYEWCPYGFLLSALTGAVALWLVFSQAYTATRLAWMALGLLLLHLFWLSFGILGFYLANQHFVLF